MTTIIAKPPITHSHSRLVTFSECPLSYKLQYLDKMPSESNDALEIGSAAHEFFEKWVNLIFTSTKETVISEDAWIGMAGRTFQKESRNQDNFKDYLEICKTFAKTYKPDPEYPDVEAERQVAFDKEWKVCAWMSPDVRFRAKIDLLEMPGTIADKIRITDWKTGYSGQVNSFQLDVYAYVCKLLFPHLKKIEIRFYYVKSGFIQSKILDVADLDVTKIQLEALMQRIESESKWKPKPGIRCLNCSVASFCTAKPSNLKAIGSPTDAEALGEEIALLEAQAKAKKKALSAYCRQNGAVAAGGLSYNHWPQESWKVDMGPFLSAVVANKVDPDEVLNADKRAIQKAMKQTPGFQEAVQPYIEVDVSTRFYGKKADQDDE